MLLIKYIAAFINIGIPGLDLMYVQALELGHLGVQLDNRLSKLKLFFLVFENKLYPKN